MSFHIQTETRGGVAILRLARGDGNALTADMAAMAARFLDIWRGDAAVACVVVCAGGPDFCTGADHGPLPRSLWSHAAAPWQQLTRALGAFDKPMILAAQGHVAGLGLRWLLAADAVVADETLTVSLGPDADPAVTRALADLVGARRAFDLLLAEGAMTGAEARAAGIATHAAPTGQSLPEALRLAHAIAALPTEVIRDRMAILRPATPRPAPGQSVETEDDSPLPQAPVYRKCAYDLAVKSDA